MNKGIIYGMGAYFIWGFMLVWLRQIKGVPPLQILGHRVAWSFVLLFAIILLRKDFGGLIKSIRAWRTLRIYTTAALLLASNWLVYIYAINADHIVESSLGYFINPLVNVSMGVVFFRERLRRWQWVPVGIAAVGVTYLAFDYGRLPWIALGLAFTFGLYGLTKKIAPLGSLHGLTLETALLFLPSLLFLGGMESQGAGWFSHHGIYQDIMLVAAGVITAVPLLLFSEAARRIPLSMLGLLQYIAPTCQFLLGVLVYREPFALTRLVGFVIIWIALVIFWMEGFSHYRRTVLAVV